MKQPLPFVFAALLAPAAPCLAQTPPQTAPPQVAAPAGPPEGLSPQEKAAWKQVETFRTAFAQLTKLKGAAFTVGVMYDKNYVQVQPDGKETTKADLLKQIAEGRAMQTVTDEEKELKAESGTPNLLPKDKRMWRPTRYEVQDDRIIVVTSPVQKQHQLMPVGAGGKAVDAEVKVLGTIKETYLHSSFGNKAVLLLERMEVVGMKVYLNGKEQPAGFNTGDAPPNL